MSMLHGGFGSSGGYQIANAVRFRASASAYFSRTFGTPSDSTIYTFSAWVKRGALGSTYRLFGAGTNTYLTFNSSDQLNLTINGVSAATTTEVFRDPSAWYHVVYWQNGSVQAICVNGVELVRGSTAAAVFNTAVTHQIGAANTSNYFDGVMSDIYFVDGLNMIPSYFGQPDPYNTNNWIPKVYNGVFGWGNNGFYLKFNDGTSATTLGYDRSGNGNNLTPSGISTTAGVTYDWLTDTPTNNYATLNQLDKASNTYSEGNLKVVYPAAGYAAALSSVAMTSGQYWAEMTVTAAPGEAIGILPATFSNVSGTTGLFGANGGYGYRHTGNKYVNGSSSAYGATFTTNDVIGIHLNLDASEITFYKQTGGSGAFSSQGAIAITAGLSWFFAGTDGTGSGSVTQTFNFGQRPFNNSSLPSGAKALCTAYRTYAAPTTSGSFTGTANANGPVVWLAGAPSTLLINGNAVTWGTHADKIAGGFKLRTASASYNASGSNTFSVIVSGNPFGDSTHSPNTAQGNP